MEAMCITKESVWTQSSSLIVVASIMFADRGVGWLSRTVILEAGGVPVHLLRGQVFVGAELRLLALADSRRLP